MPKIIIGGAKIEATPDPALQKFFKVEQVDARTIPSTARGDKAPAQTEVDLADDDLVVVEYDNGVKLWLSAKAYAEGGTLPGGGAARGVLDPLLRAIQIFHLSPAEVLGESAGDLAAMEVVRRMESHLNPGPGLYRVGDGFTQREKIAGERDLSKEGKILLLLHGTASSTQGSFRGMALPAAQNELSILRDTTAEWDRLRKQYDGGVLAFEHRTLSQSPIDNALELVELIPAEATLHLVSHSRGGLIGELLCLKAPLSDAQIDSIRARGEEYATQADGLRDLARKLAQKNWKVERFVRVACPARGTILASRRLDLYLSIILNLVGLMPGLGENPFFEFFKAAAAELIRKRTDPRDVPGIEAMMPESPLIHLLNQKGLQSKADLAVIAGDLEGEGVFGSLKTFASRLYYLQANDLVVNTDSMFHGINREGVAHYTFDRGPDVNHFHYFVNRKTRDLLMNWLTADPNKLKDAGFRELTSANLALDRIEFRGEVAAQAADVVVFVPGFMGTHLNDAQGRIWLDFDVLALGGLARLKGPCTPSALLAPPYEELLRTLALRFIVAPFEYDWRLSNQRNAAALDALLQKQLNEHSKPIHILTHLTGGQVARTVPAATWQQLRERGGRFVLLGDPAGGPNIAAIRDGQATLLRQLALLDPGGADGLAETFRSWLTLEAPGPEAPAGIRVAGSDETAANANWFADTRSGNLTRTPAIFPGILDVLQKGQTSHFSPTPILAPSVPPAGEDLLLFPSEGDLIDSVMGAASPSPLVADIATIEVSVKHGDLSQSLYPVLVGHYRGDTIVSAERRLDDLLHHSLSRLFHLDVYPAALGTSQIVRDPEQPHPPGALVIGLGDMGKLSEEALRGAVRQAIVKYALSLVEGTPKLGVYRSAALTSLLIGTWGGEAIDVETSVNAVLRAAVEANRALREAGLWDSVRVDRIEFIDLYEDLATQAIHAINLPGSRLRLNLAGDERILPARYLLSAEGGLDKRPTDQYSGGWWQRVQIEGKRAADDGEDEGELSLKFNVLTDRAVSEESASTTQVRRVDGLIAKAIREQEFNPRLAVAIYEELWPNRIRQVPEAMPNVVLEVDKESARYPWELLARRSGDGWTRVATSAGIVRQFRTPRAEQPRFTRLPQALVAAFPKITAPPGFAELKGAAEEALAVAAALKEADYQVEPESAVVKETDESFIVTLKTGDYRILHLAGHGIFAKNGDARLLIGSGAYLTAHDANLSVTPELVFLNCCHIGAIRPDSNRLAASMSEAFMNAGCRAVVAAGWALDDRAAVEFARVFYQQMLAGETLGKAIFDARVAIARDYPRTNTWGAYQCYGNPDFRLKVEGAGMAPRARRDCRTRTEFIEACRRLRQEDGPDALTAVLSQVPREWRDGALLFEFGNKYGWFGRLDRAVEMFREALADPNSGAPIQSIETLANYEDRLAKNLMFDAACKTGSEGEDLRRLAQEQTGRAIQRVEWLLELGETPERWARLGGAYRRTALFAGAERKEALEKARDSYGKGYKLSRDGGRTDPYTGLNWISLRVLTGETVQDVGEDLQAVGAEVDRNKVSSPDYWSQIAVPDCALVTAFVKGTLPEQKNSIIDDYKRVLGTTDHQGQIASVRGGILDMAELTPDVNAQEALRAIEQAIASSRNA